MANNYYIYINQNNNIMETIKTLEQFAELINASEEWKPSFNSIIEANGWKDNTGEEYGICESDTEILEFNESGKAVARSK